MVTMTHGRERRLSPRVPVRLPVVFTAEGMIHQGFATNLSQGGIFLCNRERIEQGERVNLRFMVPGCDVPLKATGRVIWRNRAETVLGCDGPQGHGIKFDNLMGCARQVLDEFITDNEALASSADGEDGPLSISPDDEDPLGEIEDEWTDVFEVEADPSDEIDVGLDIDLKGRASLAKLCGVESLAPSIN